MVWSILLVLTLSGCGTVANIRYDGQGRVEQLKLNKPGKASIKTTDGQEVSVDSKFEPLKEIVKVGPGIK